ncbi:oxysterol-binding protein-related protein 2-like isoform X2 [Tachypleus tridentatus]|uniref:oxysterol-binding protein-related protein 2-like isoform X2 n=1 Tax=Tachypleus tridentatus TaxID=6853 RepID=UPI003FD14857
MLASIVEYFNSKVFCNSSESENEVPENDVDTDNEEKKQRGDTNGKITPKVVTDKKDTVSSEVFTSPKWLRTSLPAPMIPRAEISVWSILKQCIGKELSKITMPVVFNEPLSFLQRLTEYMEYSVLLKRADECDNPVDRIEYVAAFAVSALASNWERLGKPFNPLLGETYELVREDLGFKIICEQVSHHPPISAFYADSPHFTFSGSIHPKLKFWGKYVEIRPEGTLTVELLRHKEVYTWSNVNCCVHNIIVGKLWIEQYGAMELVGHTTGMKAVINFKQAGWFKKDLYIIEGVKKLRYLYGNWTNYIKSTKLQNYEEYIQSHSNKFRPPDHPGVDNSQTIHESNSRSTNSENSKCETLSSLDIPNSVLLWQAEPRPSNSVEYYHFTLFTMSLNALVEDMRSTVAPTDSRLRPDIRYLEQGLLDMASSEKKRLEEKQRELRKRKSVWDNWLQRWFRQGENPYTKMPDWIFTHEYWERNFSRCPDIF